MTQFPQLTAFVRRQSLGVEAVALVSRGGRDQTCGLIVGQK